MIIAFLQLLFLFYASELCADKSLVVDIDRVVPHPLYGKPGRKGENILLLVLQCLSFCLVFRSLFQLLFLLHCIKKLFFTAFFTL